MKPTTLKFLGTFAAGMVASLSIFVAVRARAAGIPAAAALTYTGYLENPDGTPVTGKKSIGISVYDAETEGTEVCVVKPADFEPVSGRFQIVLPEKCTAAVAANPDLWVELEVEGSLLGRTKLGAVPYALEAAHADTATDAVKAGALDKRIADIESRLGQRSAARAHLTATQSIADSSAVAKVKLAAEDMDENAEFDAATATFTPKVAGNYFLQCSLRFETGSPGTNGWFDASVLVNAVPVQREGFYGDGWTSTRTASGVFNLAKGDAVTCGANQQNSGGAKNLDSASLTAFRLGPAD
jgi:hypothetical protein